MAGHLDTDVTMQMPPTEVHGETLQASALGHLILISLVGCAFGAYFVIRYLGLWSEQDTAVFASVIRRMQAAGRLEYAGAYHHGYAYPVWASALSQLTTVSVANLIQMYLPIFGNVSLGIFGFAMFRQLLSSNRLGLFSASILFLIPEVVFTVSRGNHEKLTVALTLLSLLALLKGFVEMSRGSHWRVYAAWVVVFYVTGFTLITMNVFFGSGFIVASSLSLVFVYLIMRVRPQDRPVLGPVVRRLVLVVGTTWLLVALVMWFVYPRAGENFVLLATAAERMSALFLSATPRSQETEPLSFTISDPYSVGATDWLNPVAYRAVSSFRWFLFVTSFGIWVVLIVRMLVKRERVSTPRLFLVAFYGAFGLQLAAAIPVDFLGLSAGSNLQVRMYTYFGLFAPPVLTVGVAAFARFLHPRFGRAVLVLGLSTGLSVFVLLSLVKATLDPSLSNRWLFYHPAEVQAMRFWDVHHQFGALWIDPEGRLAYGYELAFGESTVNSNVFYVGQGGEWNAHALHSTTLRQAAAAWKRLPPSVWLHNRVYDSGESQIYHRLPKTPFQR